MTKEELSPARLFAQGSIIPVLVLEELEDALPLAKAIRAAGINSLEITLRTKAALPAIEILRKELPELWIGAGTVVSLAQLQACHNAGACFAFSPGLTRNLLLAAKDIKLPFIPGVSTLSEVMEGMEYGYSHFKFFPAEAAGGPAMLQAIHGPFAHLRFCPTGGINAENFLNYLRLPNVACVGGSWLIPQALIKQKNWRQITDLCCSALEQKNAFLQK